MREQKSNPLAADRSISLAAVLTTPSQGSYCCFDADAARLGLDHPGVVCMDAAAAWPESHGVTARRHDHPLGLREYLSSY